MANIQRIAELRDPFVLCDVKESYIVVRHSFAVTTDKQGHAKQILMEESQYTESTCKGTPYLVFDSEFG